MIQQNTWKKLAIVRGNYCESLELENARLRESIKSLKVYVAGMKKGKIGSNQACIMRGIESAIRE